MSATKDPVQEVLGLLCERYPKTFFIFQARRRPLKIGITRELEAALGDTVDRKTLRKAIRRYATNLGYLWACRRAGAARIDLDGNHSGVVTEDEAQNAKKSIAGIKRPKAKPAPKRDGLSALREAARKRKEASGAAGGGA